MHPGYLSFLLLCITLILLASGWKAQLVGDISSRIIVLFMSCWVIGLILHFNHMDVFGLDLCCLLLVGAAIWITLMQESWTDRMHLISIGILGSSAYILFKQWIHLDFINMLLHPALYISLVLSIINAAFIRQPVHQFAVITISLIIGDVSYHYLIYRQFTLVTGMANLYDVWWLTFLGSRILSELIEQVWKGCKLMFNFWLKD